MNRRTSARTQFVVSVFVFLYQLRLRAYQRNRGEGWKDPAPFSPPWIVMGALREVARWWIVDRDVGRVRTDRRRRALFVLCWTGWQIAVRRRSADPETAKYNAGVGKTLGTIAYRSRYGLLRALPGSDE